MTAFEKWKGFIEQLIDVYLIVTPQEKERLQAELSVIEKTKCAELFQAVYNTWQSLFVNGSHVYLTGEAEKWFIFHFLDVIRENPLEGEIPTGALSKVTFVIPQGAKEKAKRFAIVWKLPENAYEIVEE